MLFFYKQETLEASQIEYNGAAQKSFQKVSCSNITDLDAVAKVLKSRAYRGDLMGENASAFGNIDIKLFSETSSGNMEFRALAGPLFYNTMRSKPKDTVKKIVAPDEVNKDAITGAVTEDQLGDSTDAITSATATEPAAVDEDNDDDDSLVSENKMLEIDIISERRIVRDDIRAAAIQQMNGPFKWSKTKLDAEHAGHPDLWNFDHVSPTWAWKHDTI